MAQFSTGKHVTTVCIPALNLVRQYLPYLAVQSTQLESCMIKQGSVQSQVLGLNRNQLAGALPETWSNLTNVSHALVI